MSKGRRNRAQHHHGRLLRTPGDVDAAGGMLVPEMPCRACYISDPVLGGGRPAKLSPAGALVADDSGTVEPLPVVLFEPTFVLRMEDQRTGTVQEAKLESIVAHGFHRLQARGGWVLRPALGWEVRRVPDGLALRDAAGNVWARGQITLDPAWVSAATSHRDIGVLFGPKLGVRVPPGMNPAAYTTARRAAEFRQGRAECLAAAALVAWHGEPARETLEWVAFLPGSFGLPLAGVFAPLPEFTRHGGPEAFGLHRVSPHMPEIPADPVRTLTVRVTRTDIDLMDPGEGGTFGQVGGVHYPEGVQAAWRQAALGQGHVLVITGPRLPGYTNARAGDDGDPGEIWAAIVPVHTR
jgi:hypothetical protein